MRFVRWPKYRTLLVALSAIGLFNATMLVKPWAREVAAETPIDVAARAPAADELPIPGFRALISFGKTSLLDKQEALGVHKAVLFVSHFLIVTRAVHDQCGQIGVDAAGATAFFKQHHAADYERASALLASYGLNAETVWALFRSDLKGHAKTLLDNHATQLGADLPAACQQLQKEPHIFARSTGRVVRGFRQPT